MTSYPCPCVAIAIIHDAITGTLHERTLRSSQYFKNYPYASEKLSLLPSGITQQHSSHVDSNVHLSVRICSHSGKLLGCLARDQATRLFEVVSFGDIWQYTTDTLRLGGQRFLLAKVWRALLHQRQIS